MGSTPTRFRQLIDDSTAFVGVEALNPRFKPRVLFPICSQILLALLLLFGLASAQPRTIAIPFRDPGNGLILADPKINGKLSAMLVDSGSYWKQRPRLRAEMKAPFGVGDNGMMRTHTAVN